MSERSPIPHPEQSKTVDLSKYTRALTALADKMQNESYRRGKRLKIPLSSGEKLDEIRERLNKDLGKIMRHPSESSFKKFFSKDTLATSITLSANTSSWEREVVKPVNPREPNIVKFSPGWNTLVGISIEYMDGKHEAIQTVWMSTDSKNHDGQPMLQRSVTKRKSSDIDPMDDPVPATKKQAKCFLEVVQDLYDIYEADQRRKGGDPYAWFD